MDIFQHGALHYSNGSLHYRHVKVECCIPVMTERHTAVNISRRLSETIKEWDHLRFAVHDNGSNMNLAMKLCELFPKDLGCTGHTLQLAIKAGLVLLDIAKAIDAARCVVSHFRH